MKLIKFEGCLQAPNNPVEAQLLEDRLLDVVTGAFDEELEMMTCGIEEVEDE